MSQTSSKPLAEVLASTNQLLSRFAEALSSQTSQAPSSVVNSPTQDEISDPNLDPLKLLHDSAMLIKAHATKLGLLLLNKPFTPSAIATILSELCSTCLPALMSSLELLPPTRYSFCVRDELRSRIHQLLSAVTELVRDIEAVAAAAASSSSSSSSTTATKKTANGKATQVALKKQDSSTLSSTAQVWSACATLLQGSTTPACIILAKAEAHRALLRDALDELKDWVEDDDEGYDDGEASEADGDVLFAPLKCPAGEDNAALRALVGVALKKLGLVELAFKQVMARRLKTFDFAPHARGDTTQSAEKLHALDRVLLGLKRVPEETDELAGRFYELDHDAALAQLRRCCHVATETVAVAARTPWGTDVEDAAFASWFDGWESLLARI